MQQFKTISFPKEYTSTSKSEFIKLAFSLEKGGDLFQQVSHLRSSELRELLGNPTYEAILSSAEEEKRSINNHCLYILNEKLENLQKSYGNDTQMDKLLSSSFAKAMLSPSSGTFKDNRTEKIHRWYPYIEGYSCSFVDEILKFLSYEPSHVYDPFSGTGTTQIVASHAGLYSTYSEINPYMRFVIDTKVNRVIGLLGNWKHHRKSILSITDKLMTGLTSLTSKPSLFLDSGYENFFRKDVAEQIDFLKIEISFISNNLERNLIKLALTSIAVEVSNMTRRADLRYKTEAELTKSNFDVGGIFYKKIIDMIDDIDNTNPTNLALTTLFAEDARNASRKSVSKFDLVITSPPYVNGTNYFRNTKLELFVGGFINSYAELPGLCTKAIVSGINNVSNRLGQLESIPEVELIAKELELKAYDTRIPKLIRYYFSDMKNALTNIANNMADDAKMFLDIGDSQFAGVHVPADEILGRIGESVGLEIVDKHYIRKRYSKNGMQLKQVLLMFNKKKASKKFLISGNNKLTPADLVRENYSEFKRRLPYRENPYSKRNWGHPLHSLCSYQGKLKPSIAHFLVNMFSQEGMTILDPLGGVGTIPIEAALNGRKSISNDISRMSYAISLAKLKRQDPILINKEIENLEKFIKTNQITTKESEALNFGFNKTLKEYYHSETLKEIILARRYFATKILTPESAFVLGCLLHILHGNRPYALSRRSHSITPFAPRGEFIYKNLIEKLKEKVYRMLEKDKSETFIEGESYNLDFMNLDTVMKNNTVDVVITSPPFYSSTKFYLANWLRMWFCGWDKPDFEKKKDNYLETKQMKNFQIYNDFFSIMKRLLKKDGSIIMHLGRSGKFNMGQELIKLAGEYFEVYGLIDESVTHIEKFGVRDQGSTKGHQYLFLINS